MAFGFIVCFDSFLYTFTILPIRFVLALGRLVAIIARTTSVPLPPSQKADILRTFLLVISIILLGPLTDASKIYHSIRGQDTIKLYVIFNALEVRPDWIWWTTSELMLTDFSDRGPLVRFHRARYHRLSILTFYLGSYLASDKAHISYVATTILFLSCTGIHR